MNRLIVIIGPTAIGKTKVSIDLAKKFRTEIISGDSMLLYRGMNIGTAKPTPEEQSGIKHHLIDCLNPDQAFSVTDFQQIASNHISNINAKGLIPILAGGTGLYVKALLEGYEFNSTPSNDSLRVELETIAKNRGNIYLHQKLFEVAPDVAQRLHPNDLRRVIRALEIHHESGDHISQSKQSDSLNRLMYDTVVIGLTVDRSILYNRINERVDSMIANGLIKEVSFLLEKGIPPTAQAMQGIGYKEIVAYLQGETDLPTAIDNIKKATRHFAKRQLTWYRKMPYIDWFDVNHYPSYQNMLETFYKHIAGKFHIKVE